MRPLCPFIGFLLEKIESLDSFDLMMTGWLSITNAFVGGSEKSHVGLSPRLQAIHFLLRWRLHHASDR